MKYLIRSFLCFPLISAVCLFSSQSLAGPNLLHEWREAVDVDGDMIVAIGRQYFDSVSGLEYTKYFDEEGNPLPAAVSAAHQKSWSFGAAETDAAVKNIRKSGQRQIEPPKAGSVASALSIVIPRPDMTKIRKQDEQINDFRKGLMRIGTREKLPNPVGFSASKKSAKSAWTTLADGSKLWVLNIEATDAEAVRVHFQNVVLPAGCFFFVYKSDDPNEAVGPYDQSSLYRGGDCWSESVFSSHVTVECSVPASIDVSDVRFEVKEIAYIYVNVFEQGLRKVGACHYDVTCYPAWNLQKNAVAGLGSIGSVGVLWCTGCLLNDTDPYTYVDYFMTANHCVGSQGDADTLEFYWFYQTATCNGTVPSVSSVPRTGGGADYLAGRDDFWGNDFSFLRLRQETPAGVGYAGWTTEGLAPGDAVIGIHHPDGSWKRINFGHYNSANKNYWSVQWSQGVTEPGSSGSPLFDAEHRFVGQLWGGSSSCVNQNGIDDYGRFDISYPVIKDWLNPGSLSSGLWYIRTLIPGSDPIFFGGNWGNAASTPVPGDYDHDGIFDLSVFLPSTGEWFVRSLNPDVPPLLFGESWGDASMVPVPGDYNGDGNFDLALFQPLTGDWYIRQLDTNAAPIAFGMNWGDSSMVPVAGDYNGDGLFDLAVFQPSTGNWYIRTLIPDSDPVIFGMSWGDASMVPVPGDYNGDGLYDLALYQPSTGNWYIRTLIPGSDPIVFGMNWGGPGLTAVPGDYNGDGLFDLAVFQSSSGNWYVRTLVPGSDPIAFGFNWGKGLEPVPGDYNGDGLWDLAVFLR